jgi:hypothetical protein
MAMESEGPQSCLRNCHMLLGRSFFAHVCGVLVAASLLFGGVCMSMRRLEREREV